MAGLTNPDVAKVLGLSLPNAKSRIYRAGLFLRDRLSDQKNQRKRPKNVCSFVELMKRNKIITRRSNEGIMAAIPYAEKNRHSVDIKAIYKWMRKKLGTSQDHRFMKSKDKEEKINQNEYSPKYIAELLPEKALSGKAFFYFINMSDYITLSSNGQLNVRGGEEDLFRVWGRSEFRNLTPSTVFQELEEEIIRINVAVSGKDYSFNSYSEFTKWLKYQSGKS